MSDHWWDMVAGGAGTLAGLALAEKGYSDLGKIGERAFIGFAGDGGLADVLSGRLDFQPYTVTTATGSNFGMSQAPSTGSIGRVNPNLTNQGLFDAYNAANTSPEVQAAYNLGASPNASANDLAAFNMGVPDLNNDGLISDEEFRSWSGYENWLAQNPNHPRGPNKPGSQPGSRFTGEYDASGNPIYVSPPTSGTASTAASTTGTTTGTTAGEQYAPGQMDYLLTLSDDEKKFYEDRLAGAKSMFDLAEGNTVTVEDPDGTIRTIPREQQVYERMMAAMAPERERQRLALEERLAGQGRLGVRTGMFGGTPEQLAQAQAEEEARNQAILNAMTFAGQEQQRQAALGSGMLAAGYVPQAQLLGAVTPGMTASERRRQSVSEATQAYGETYAAGLQALLSSALGQAGIAGNFGTTMAKEALGGLFST